MAIDLKQFHQVFFEESGEGLDVMEQALMEIDPQSIDNETINAIFRSAHSIKGGSATFGFKSIAEFTHVLETLLDEVRSGKRGLTDSNIDLLLRSVDCMREMLQLIEEGDSGATEQSDELKKQFTAILENKDSVVEAALGKKAEEGGEPVETESENQASKDNKYWEIIFKPNKNLFLSGNDPMRNIKALAELGKIDVQCHTDSMPSLESMCTEDAYLFWTISLKSHCDRASIGEVFEWIEEDCELQIQESAIGPIDIPISNAQWRIVFKPEKGILLTGNEPLRLIRELKKLGEMDISVDTGALPSLHDIEGSECHLAWDMTLYGEGATRSKIEEVFEWVMDLADITIVEHSEEAPIETGADYVGVDHVGVDNGEAKEPSDVSARSDVRNTNKRALANQNKTTAKKTAETSSIRVGIDKVDTLINMVGELVITQSMLGQLGSEHMLERVPKLIDGLNQLEQNTRELQECVMKIRMLPISFAFSRFPRMVRDLSQVLGKNVNLVMNGENTELDKTVMEKIGDPLVHLVRNAVDHGLEPPDERVTNGKSDTGTITLNAFHQSGNVVIEIIDDGRGLDRDRILEKAIENGIISDKESESLSDSAVYDLIFQPGFSTAATVSDVSGRGVGMDVVKRNIQALNGHVEITSKPGKGSTITIKLPLTLAILDGQLVRVGGNTYIFSLVSIIESLQCRENSINHVGGGCSVFKLRDDYVPIVELHKVFSVIPDSEELEDSLLVVVEQDGIKVGIVVDELLGQQQVVIKSLEKNYRRVDGISGATILGDGTVALILDIPGIMRLAAEKTGNQSQSLAEIISAFENKSANEHIPLRAANG